MKKPTVLTKEFLEQEEKEAKEKGLTIFQLRAIKKRHEKMAEKRLLTLSNKKKATELKKLKEKQRKQKEKLKLKEKKLKELEKEKLKLKEKREKEKPQQKKKKMGRPKKRGPKKQYWKKYRVIKKQYKERPTYNYKIVACLNNKQKAYIGNYNKLSEAYEKINQLLEESKKVVYPAIYTKSNENEQMKYEYLILEKNSNRENNIVLRNDFGKLVEQKTNSDVWKIVDKFSFDVEETFWVWGYDKKTDRKTFSWICDNLILHWFKNEYDILFILTYKNKLIIKNDEDDMNIVFCKNISECIRLYNEIKEKIKKNNRIYFIGSYDKIGNRRKKLEESLMELTGWSKEKIQRPFTKNNKN